MKSSGTRQVRLAGRVIMSGRPGLLVLLARLAPLVLRLRVLPVRGLRPLALMRWPRRFPGRHPVHR
jgi:hypothetical protein